MKEQQQLRTTFGQLEHVADKVVLPSTLNYRERAEMQKKHGCEYGRLYNSSGRLSVYDRLTADAAVRQHLHAMRMPASAAVDMDFKLATASPPKSSSSSRTGSCSGSGSKMPSGFSSNNNTPMLTRTLHEAASMQATRQTNTLASLHPITLRSYYKKHPLDLLAEARPAAQTTNQTLRMLGTYNSDTELARMLNVHIPAAGVKPGCFHPDVKC